MLTSAVVDAARTAPLLSRISAVEAFLERKACKNLTGLRGSGKGGGEQLSHQQRSNARLGDVVIPIEIIHRAVGIFPADKNMHEQTEVHAQKKK